MTLASRVGIGFTLQPDREFLALLEPCFGPLADYFEITPETTWAEHDADHVYANSYADTFVALAHRWAPAHAPRRPCVGHGVGLSVGSLDPDDRPRQDLWHRRLLADHARFQFAWLSDHLAVTYSAGEAMTLPLPVVPHHCITTQVQARLARLQTIVPAVGLENTAHYFALGDLLAEASMLTDILRLPGSHLILDLHNLWINSRTFGFTPQDYLDRLDLTAVLEIHISGGSLSPAMWLRSGATRHLDSHDTPVPEPVWQLLAEVAPRCPNLRGVTLERMEGTVTQADVPAVYDELLRLRQCLNSLA